MKYSTFQAFVFAAGLAVAPVHAQTANDSPTVPTPSGTAGAPPVSAAAPSGGATPGGRAAPKAARVRAAKVDPGKADSLTPEERRQQRKADRDMNICTGC